jgi:myosin heavy subunit
LVALLALAGCAEYDDPLQAAVRAHMLQDDRDTQYLVDQYKAEIARIDKQKKELDKISDYYATDIERMRKDSEQMDKYKAELERYSRFLDKLQEQENQDQQQPTPQKPNPQSI